MVNLGVAGGAAVVLLGGLTATGIGLAAAAWNNGSADRCADGSDRVTLSVTTAPTLAAPISRLAADYGRAHAGGDGPCVSIAVSSISSDRVLDVLSRPASQESDGAPDIWIPESDDWLELAQESDSAAATLPAKAPTIAGSPVVIAMPRLMAQRLGWPEHHVTWAELAAHANESNFWSHQGEPRWGDFRFAMANPENSTAGLRAVLGTVGAATGRPLADLTTGTFDQDRGAQLTVLRMERSVDWLPENDSQLFDSVRTGGTENGSAGTAPSAFPALESDVIAYNRSIASGSGGGRPATTLVASYPSDGMFTATVPYIVLKKTAAQPARARAADAFDDYLRGPAGRAALTAAGFRTPAELAGQDDPTGLSATLTATDGVRLNPPRIASTDASDSTLGTARRFFRHIHQREVTLTVLDTSGSMAAPVPGTVPVRTRMQMAVEASLTGLGLFAGDSDVGLWQLASDLDGTKGYRELSPIARLDSPGSTGTHRDDLVAAQSRLVPGGDTDLYATTLAAFRSLTQHYVPGRLNQVVILTDGRDDASRGADVLSLDSLVAQLQAGYNPQRPVEVITIAYSDDADSAALQRISAATHARSYVSHDPRDVLGVYLDALTRAGT